jgi:hypothetical protein
MNMILVLVRRGQRDNLGHEIDRGIGTHATEYANDFALFAHLPHTKKDAGMKPASDITALSVPKSCN